MIMKPLITTLIIIGIILLGLYFWFTTDTEKPYTPLPKQESVQDMQKRLYDEKMMRNLDK